MSPEHDELAFAQRRRGRLASLWRRVHLTYRYLGLGAVLWRVLTLPLRLTPLRTRLGLGTGLETAQQRAEAWYRVDGRPVTVVIPTFGPPDEALAAIASIRSTTDPKRVDIVVTDDGSEPEHQARLRELRGVEVLLGERNVGFAANVNRGIQAAVPGNDVVLFNSDVEAHHHWLACLQYAAYRDDDIGVVGPKLLYPDGRIQSAGSHRNPGAPEWFDHRYRFKSSGYGPANVVAPALGMTGACLYVKRELIGAIGPLDEDYGMGYEDVDWCLRAWQAGYRVIYFPAAELVHKESVTRGREPGTRELDSQRLFWRRWGDFFDAREVRTAEGALRVIYVTEDTGVGGGHRDVFEHVNRLRERGHDAQVWSLGGQPDWFELAVGVRSFADYEQLARALGEEPAIKIATWWNTAAPVWRASVPRGIPVYFVQDIETSYYPDSKAMRHHVLASYREEFSYMTISGWNRDRLGELGLDAALIPPGIDLDTFKPVDGPRRGDMLLAIGRSHPLKNLPLTVDAWKALPKPRPELCLFGIEPELGPRYGARYVDSPSDGGVNELFNDATAFVQTSTHEGFCLPPLEAMATGGAVVCTDAHGNRDFCRDGVNCLMPEPTKRSVADAIQSLLEDEELRRRLGAEGMRTAAEYAWEKRIDTLEAFLQELASERRAAPPSPAQPATR